MIFHIAIGVVGFIAILTEVCWLTYRAERGVPKRHKTCLQNIDRLERELFPEWFEQPLKKLKPQVAFELKPGMKWPVGQPNFISMSACAAVTRIELQTALDHQQALVRRAANHKAALQEQGLYGIH